MFNSILKDLRKQKRVTQIQLAKDLGVSKSTIAMYEMGQRMPPPSMLLAIADYFGTDVNTLLEVDSAPAQSPVRFEDCFSGIGGITPYVPTEKDLLIDKVSEQLYSLSDDEIKQVLSYARFLQHKD